MKIEFVEDSAKRSQICEKILRALPDWFGIEKAIVDYTNDVRNMDTWVILDGSEESAFLSVKKHNNCTAEIHVMGVLLKHHRRGLGRRLVNQAVEDLQLKGFKYLTVKTLSASRPNKEYDQTRQFYQNIDFDPVEEFKTLWDEFNPCLLMIKNIEKPNGK